MRGAATTNAGRLPSPAGCSSSGSRATGSEAGDRVQFTLRGPGGAPVLAHTVELDQGWANLFQFVGAKRPGNAWPPGTYRGEVILQRAGLAPVSLEPTVELR